MQKKQTLFSFVDYSFMIFGFTITVLNIFCLLFGDKAGEISTIFSLGSNGLSAATLFRFLLLSAIISALRMIFFTDMLIRNMSVPVRTVCMFSGVIATMVFFIVRCRWFPIDSLAAWAMFFLCFVVSAGLSTVITILKEKEENTKMQNALERFKDGKDGRYE